MLHERKFLCSKSVYELFVFKRIPGFVKVLFMKVPGGDGDVWMKSSGVGGYVKSTLPEMQVRPFFKLGQLFTGLKSYEKSAGWKRREMMGSERKTWSKFKVFDRLNQTCFVVFIKPEWRNQCDVCW